MDPLVILLIGMAVVVGGILGLRLHAFLALTLAALVVGYLTSPEQLARFVESDVVQSERKAEKLREDGTLSDAAVAQVAKQTESLQKQSAGVSLQRLRAGHPGLL